MPNTKKTFDCVEMKHRGADKVQQAIEGMTLEEELAFWAEGTRELLARKKQLQAERQASASDGKTEPDG